MLWGSSAVVHVVLLELIIPRCLINIQNSASFPKWNSFLKADEGLVLIPLHNDYILGISFRNTEAIS